METKNLICIACPIGCSLTVTKDDKQVIVNGNSCQKGEVFGIQEMIDPKRMLTTTILTDLGQLLPVISTSTISKKLLLDAIEILKTKCVKTPIKQGDIIIENILNTGVNMIASKTMG